MLDLDDFCAIGSLNNAAQQLIKQNGGLYQAADVSAGLGAKALMVAGVMVAAPVVIAAIPGATTVATVAAPVLTGLQIYGVGKGIYNGGQALANGDINGALGSFGNAGLDSIGLKGNIKQTFQQIKGLASCGWKGFLDPWNACFAAGTTLLTPTGEKAIEEFQVGDWILSAPEHDPNAPVEAKQVEELFRREGALLNVHIGEHVIRTTAQHPFYVANRGWTAAENLRLGDQLRSHDGQWLGVDSVCDSGERSLVYNLRIADYHTYFVGSRDWGFDVWTHNIPCLPGSQSAGGNAPKPVLPDDAIVVRGGIQKPAIQTHPSGIKGISVESAPGLTAQELAMGPPPIPNTQIRITTVGQIRQVGGNVEPTPGLRPNHATLTGLTPDEIQNVLSPPIPNPARPANP